jgi:hypothetical protein
MKYYVSNLVTTSTTFSQQLSIFACLLVVLNSQSILV